LNDGAGGKKKKQRGWKESAGGGAGSSSSSRTWNDGAGANDWGEAGEEGEEPGWEETAAEPIDEEIAAQWNADWYEEAEGNVEEANDDPTENPPSARVAFWKEELKLRPHEWHYFKEQYHAEYPHARPLDDSPETLTMWKFCPFCKEKLDRGRGIGGNQTDVKTNHKLCHGAKLHWTCNVFNDIMDRFLLMETKGWGPVAESGTVTLRGLQMMQGAIHDIIISHFPDALQG